MNEEEKRKVVDAINKKLADDGMIIQGGWRAYEILTLDPINASEIQRIESRKAYFFGAQHLWATMMNILEPGAEPTEKDLERMSKVNDELEKFVAEMKGLN